MSIFFVFWITIQIAIGYNLVLPLTLYLFRLFTLKREIQEVLVTAEIDYAIIVTAYQQTELLPNVINSLLQLNYSNYLVYVVADNCDISDLSFSSEKVILLRPEKVLASNTQSHFYAIKRFLRNHEVITIIDSDNLVDPSYLNELNIYFRKGFKAVQGLRLAKNLNTTYACLDAARDIYYHFYDGETLFQLGSSATLAGSGMAFTTDLYNRCLQHLDIKGAGFDKVLQFEIVKINERIAFTRKAIVYDQKITKPDQLVKQRARWINTWFKYFTFGFRLAGRGIISLNSNMLLFGIILLRPPLFIFLLISLLMLVINVFLSNIFALIWIGSLVLFILGFYLSLLHYNADKRIYTSLFNIPKFMFYQVLSLAKVRKANKYSIATTHTT